MQIVGQRRDGALFVHVGGGVAVILHGDRITPPSEDKVIGELGPWQPADNSFEARQRMMKRLEHARVAPLASFHLIGDSMSFDERRRRVCDAICSSMGMPSSGGYPMSMNGPYIPENGIGDDWVVYCYNGKDYGVTYSIDETTGQVTLNGPAEEVVKSWDTLAERAAEDESEDQATGETDEATELSSKSDFFKKLIAGKKAAKLKKMGSNPVVPAAGTMPTGSTPPPMTGMKY